MKGSSTFSCFSVRNLLTGQRQMLRVSNLLLRCSLAGFLDLILRSFLLRTFSPACLYEVWQRGYCSHQSSAEGTQHTAEPWPSLRKKGFNKRRTCKFSNGQSGRWETVFFLSVWLYGHAEGNTEPLAWKPQVSFQGTMGLSTGWAWDVHTGQGISVSGTFQSVPSFGF